MTFEQYLIRVANAKGRNPDWRMGQTYFNVLEDVNPKAADKIRSTDADPFYDDSKIGEFLAYIQYEFT